MNNRIKMTIDMEVTVPQALALQAMFEYWNVLASQGSSRHVSFFVDGDGNFKPKCKIGYSDQIPELTDELRNLAIVDGIQTGDRKYDFDLIAWNLGDKKFRR